MCYFSVAGLKHPDQGNLQKGEFIWGFRFQRFRVCNDGDGVAIGSDHGKRNRKLRDQIVGHKHGAERVVWK